MATNKVRDAILDGLPAALKQTCLSYLAMRSRVAHLGEMAREAQRVRHTEACNLNRIVEQIEDDDTAYLEGAIVFNLRNGRFYEHRLDTRSAGCSFYHLNAKTGRRISPYSTYTWGPKLLLPDSHPFVKKRANARLAERLEGKDV